jgi:hypothetical protein
MAAPEETDDKIKGALSAIQEALRLDTPYRSSASDEATRAEVARASRATDPRHSSFEDSPRPAFIEPDAFRRSARGLEPSHDVSGFLIDRDPYEAELSLETVRAIQKEADKILSQEEWVQIDGYAAR